MIEPESVKSPPPVPMSARASRMEVFPAGRVVLDASERGIVEGVLLSSKLRVELLTKLPPRVRVWVMLVALEIVTGLALCGSMTKIFSPELPVMFRVL